MLNDSYRLEIDYTLMQVRLQLDYRMITEKKFFHLKNGLKMSKIAVFTGYFRSKIEVFVL